MLIPPPAISPRRPERSSCQGPERAGRARSASSCRSTGPRRGAIQVYHRNRMIQLAILRGPVVADHGRRPRCEDRAEPRDPTTGLPISGPESSSTSPSPARASTAGVADEEPVFDNDRIEGVVPTLTRILESIPTVSPRGGGTCGPDVVETCGASRPGQGARRGHRSAVASQLGDRPLDRVQVLLESASDFLPIELVYDFPTPSTDAGLCPGWKGALETGRCESDHAAKGPRHLADTVCPLGFSALSR